MCIGIALVLGVFTNYISFPSGDPLLFLLAGVLLVCYWQSLLDGVAYTETHCETMEEVDTSELYFQLPQGLQWVFSTKHVAASMAPDCALPQAGKLTPYHCIIYFSTGVLLSNFLFNTQKYTYRPSSGEK